MQISFKNIRLLRALPFCLLAVLVSACDVEQSDAANIDLMSTDAPLAVPLARPHKKLGVEMSHLAQNRGASLIKQARLRELMVNSGHLHVQLAYEGREEELLGKLEALKIPVLHSFPRFQRLDVGLRTYKDLDAVITLGSVYRVEALSPPLGAPHSPSMPKADKP